MTTLSRAELRSQYLATLTDIPESVIQDYVTNIQERVLLLNKQGQTNYQHYFHKGCGLENRLDAVREIARRVQAIFMDSDVVFHKNAAPSHCSIEVIWGTD
jgi:hypothetical protein